MKRLPTDLQILDIIYSRYYSSFTAYSNQNKNRTSKIFVPIDIEKVANIFGVDRDIILSKSIVIREMMVLL